MNTYNEILKHKIAHYGRTEAAYEFAAVEYACQFVDQHKPKWVKCKQGDFLEDGEYAFLFEDKSIFTTFYSGEICYKRATHYCKINLPTPPTE